MSVSRWNIGGFRTQPSHPRHALVWKKKPDEVRGRNDSTVIPLSNNALQVLSTIFTAISQRSIQLFLQSMYSDPPHKVLIAGDSGLSCG